MYWTARELFLLRVICILCALIYFYCAKQYQQKLQRVDFTMKEWCVFYALKATTYAGGTCLAWCVLMSMTGFEADRVGQLMAVAIAVALLIRTFHIRESEWKDKRANYRYYHCRNARIESERAWGYDPDDD